MSTFAGINSALSALQAHRKTMDVIGQNLANVNTTGYTRQRAELSEMTGGGTPSVYVTPRVVGGGVSVTAVSRAADALSSATVDARTAEHALLAGRAETLDALDAITNEPSESGLSSQLNEMWKAWQSASTNVGSSADAASRQNVLQRTQTVVDTLRSRAADITTMWEKQLQQARAEVDEVNAAISNVASLNDQVQRSTGSGGNGNELMDQRDALVTRIIELTGATAQQGSDGRVDLFLGGSALVQGTRGTPLTLTVAPSTTLLTATPDKLSFTVSGMPAPLTGGSLAARREALGTTLPAALKGYDAVAQAVGEQVNTWQLQGADGAGVPTAADTATSRAARPVFGGDSVPGTYTAGTITLEMRSGADLGLALPGNGINDGSNAKRISGLGTSKTGPDQVWSTNVSGLASRASAASLRATAAQNTLTAAVKDQQGAAGVNLDEETANLIAAQRAYQGAARVLTAVDEMLDVLINKTGIVGR